MKTKKKQQAPQSGGIPRLVYGVVAGACAGMAAVFTYGPGAIILVAALAVFTVYMYYVTENRSGKKKSLTHGRSLATPLIAFAIIGMFSTAGARYYSSSFADSVNTCTAAVVGTKNTVGNPDSRWSLNPDQTAASAKVVVTGDAGCTQPVTISTWQAPDPNKGRPYNTQTFHGSATYSFGVGTNNVQIQLPDCYYQVDLLHGTEAQGADGTPVYPTGAMMASLHGGTKACTVEQVVNQPPVTPVVTVVNTPPTSTPPAAVLPNTGPGMIVFIIGAFAAMGGYIVHRIYAYRTSKK